MNFIECKSEAIKAREDLTIRLHHTSVGYITYLVNQVINYALHAEEQDFLNWFSIWVACHENEQAIYWELKHARLTPDDRIKTSVVTKFLGAFLIPDMVCRLPKGIDIILPWDITTALTKEVSWKGFEDIPMNRYIFSAINFDNFDELPVKVRVDHKSIKLNLTQDFAIGILLFSVEMHMNFNMCMFDNELGANYLTENHCTPYFFTHKKSLIYRSPKYVVTTREGKYAFSSLEFIQGFNTAAEWINIDPDLFITELTQYAPEPTGEMVITEITF